MEIPSIVEKVVEHLRAKIISGEIPPGQRLKEDELAFKLDVSRPPIREAFRILVENCLAKSIPRKGAYVTELSVEDFNETYEVRAALEYAAIDLLKQKNIRDLPEVAKTISSASLMDLDPTKSDIDDILNYQQVITNFHVKIVEATGNKRIIHFFNNISFSWYRYNFPYLAKPGNPERSFKEHSRILKLIQKGDYDEAKAYLSKHIHSSFVRQRAILENMLSANSKEQPNKQGFRG